MVKAANGEPKPQRSRHRKAKVLTETSVPNGNDTTSYLTNDTKVKISVSPKKICIRLLEDTSIAENFITNTTRVEETAVSLDMERNLRISNFAGILEAHLATVSRNSHGSGGTLSSPDNSHWLKSSCKRDHLSNSKNRESTNSENGVNIEIPLKGKKKQTRCIKPQVYDDALDITEHHTHSKNERDLSNSTESSYTSIIKQKALEHKLKKKIISVKKQDLFDVLHQTKQIVKDTPSKSGNLNTDSDITNCCDQPKKFESRSSTDSILNMKPTFLLKKKASRVHGKNGFGSLMMDPCNNIEPIAVRENKTGYISSESASSISPAALAVGHNFKKISLKRGKFDSLVENLVVENCVQNIQPNVNDTCSSRQDSKDICAELDVLKAPAFDKIDGKINKKHLQHNLFGSVVGKEESFQQNVEEQHTDISLDKNYTQNTFAANVSADIDDLKAPVYPKIVGKINKKHAQHSFFASDVESDDENVEEQNSDIVVTKNCAKKTLATNTKESSDISVAQKFVMNVFNKEKSGSISPQTLKLSQIQGFSHSSQSIEGRRQMNEGDQNSSVNKLVGRKFFPSIIGTSVHNSPVLPEFGRSTDSPVDSLTISKFRPKITSSKLYLAKDRIAEQYPHTSAAIQQKVASNTCNILTHNKEQIDQSNNPTVCQPKSTDDVSAEINYKKRKKCDSECDNSLPSSDLTFDPDNVPHSTMVQSSSKKKRPPPDMHRKGNKSRRSLINSFGDLAEVSKESGKRISMETENAVIRFTSNGRESENELAVETEINYNGTKIGQLQPNEHCSNTVKEDSSFANKISVPENLYAVSDDEPFAERISTNILKSLSLMPRSDIDVSQVFSHASHKTKSVAKSSSVNSQEELIKADGKNEKKRQGNSKIVIGKLRNSSENIVSGEIFNPQSTGGDTKCSVSLPRVGKVSSDSNSKTHENSHRNEEINTRESDSVSLRAERRESSSYSFAEIPCNKLSEADALTSKKNSNLKISSKVTGTLIENTSDYSEAPNSRKALSTQKETPELRGLASLSLSASHLNKISHKETSSSFKNSSKGSTRAKNKNSTVGNVTNSKIIYPNSPDLCDAIGQLENERGSHTDHQQHLTEADDSDAAPAQNSVINEEVSELSLPLPSASRVNTSSHKENFLSNFENSREVRSKEISKNLVISSIPNAKITHSDSSNTNNDKRPYLKDSLHRKRQTGNRRQSNPDNQPQLKEDDGAEGERSAKGSKLLSHQKKVDAKQTQVKPTARACFLIDGEQYKNPKLVRPKRWINQRFYNYVLPKFDKQYGFCGTVKCEKFVELLCSEVTACISNRKNWDMHVDKVQEILREHLSIKNFVDFLIFAEQYLPDQFVFKLGLTYEKRCKNK